MRLKWEFWDIMGHFETTWDNLGHFGNNSEDFLTSLDHLDCFPSHFRPFYPLIGSLKKARITDRQTDGPTDGWTDRSSCVDPLAWTHLKISFNGNNDASSAMVVEVEVVGVSHSIVSSESSWTLCNRNTWTYDT